MLDFAQENILNALKNRLDSLEMYLVLHHFNNKMPGAKVKQVMMLFEDRFKYKIPDNYVFNAETKDHCGSKIQRSLDILDMINNAVKHKATVKTNDLLTKLRVSRELHKV